MPENLDKCVKSVMESGKSEIDAWVICNAQFADKASAPQKIHRQFADLASYSATDKTAISVRDGVLEYLGSELGLEPAEKVFTVYRSPATIANVHPMMTGIPLTDEHVEIDVPAPETGSSVSESTMIDMMDPDTETRVAIKNRLSLNDTAVMMLENKRELSLGYNADLVPHERYDFEQINIVPHHLAAVPAGRCGPLCSFLDRRPPQPSEEDNMPKEKLHKAFLDADGAVSLEQIVEMATALPEAIRKVPVDRLQEIMPALQEIMGYAKEQGVAPEPEAGTEDEDKPDMEGEDMAEKEEKAFGDAAAAIGVKAKTPEDLQKAFEDAKRTYADEEVKRFSEVVSKARDFVDESYDFTGKTTSQVMRDALATEYGKQEFADGELATAFKLLKKSAAHYDKFGAGDQKHPLDEIGEKELG